MEIILSLAIFGFVALVMRAIISHITKQDVYQERLNILREPKSEEKSQPLDFKRVLWQLVRIISGLFARRSLVEKIQNNLILAGIPLRGEEYLALCFLVVFLLPLLAYILTANLWLGITMGGLGFIFPRIYTNYRKEKRIQLLNGQLGDALVIMANALRAGFGFQQAMDAVRKEMPAPIASEFAWTLREMSLGFSTEEALANLNKRVGSETLDMVVTGIIIQRQVGGNLAEILDNISETIRDRARIKREIRVMTAQGRLSGWIIGLLPVVLIFIMLIISPDYLNCMLEDKRGIAVLLAGAGSELFGMLIIRRIIRIDY